MRCANDSSDSHSGLPPCAVEYIASVVRKVRYRRKVRRDIEAELTMHFEDELQSCTTTEERDAKARQVIEGFGDPKLLAVLCRRAKKRCRPLWAKVLVRSSQAVGIVILYTVVCMLPLVLGRPVVKVNYVEWLNERWKPQGAGVENAKQYYDQAVKLYVEPPEPVKRAMSTWSMALEHWDASDRQALGVWLAENRAAFDAFRQGGNSVHYWPVNAGGPTSQTNVLASLQMQANMTSQFIKTIEKYRKVATAFRGEIAYETSEGRVAEALDDCLVLQRVGRHLQGKNSLSEQLIGIVTEQSGYDGMLAIIERPDVTGAALERVQVALLAAFDPQRRVIDLDCERAIWYDVIQRAFTDDGRGGGRVVGRGLLFAAGKWSTNFARLFLFRYPDRRTTTEMVNRYFEQAQAALSIPPARSESEQPWQAAEQTASGNMFLELVAPAHRRLGLQEWRVKTHEAATIAAVAIVRYKLDKGQYPARFEELVEVGCLPSLLADPFGKGPLSYRRTDDGFLLYSWGPNLSDEGGRPSVDANGEPKMWADNNDWVFWPVTRSSN